MPLRLRTLDTFDDPEAALAAYFIADGAAFGWPDEPAQLRAKRLVVDPARYLLADWDGEPVGGAGSFAFELTLPGGVQVAAAGTSDVGVVPTHRRRGIASELLSTQLRSLAAAGTPVAVLHASEAGIYHRFGFGPCAHWRHVRIDARRARFREDCPDPGGSLHVVQRADAHDVCAQVHDRVRRVVPGGISRPDTWWPVVLGDTDVYLGGTADHLVMVHRDDTGRPDGYAIYKVDHDWARGQANHVLSIWELVGESAPVELALWRALVDHDLVREVTGPIAVDHPLFDVVVDGRQVGMDWQQDLLWARPLDVATLLSSRRYGAPGRVVLGIDDPFLPEVGGTFELSVDDSGEGRCTRTDAAPGVHLDVSELGAMLLGGTSLRRLVRAGRASVVDPADAVSTDAMFGVDPLPWCWVRF
jgi:predicted acetyltransferase